MPTNLPPRPALLLRVFSEPWEEKCRTCKACGGSGDAPNAQFTCSVCHGSGTGTGTRRVRLVGVVEVGWVERLRTAGWSDWLNVFHTDIDFRGDISGTIEKLVLRYRANTLPDSLREGLRVEEVEE